MILAIILLIHTHTHTFKIRLPHLLPTGTNLSPPRLEPPNPSCLCVKQQFEESTIIGQNLAPSFVDANVVTPVYFHHGVQPRFGALPHTMGMCGIATGISAALTDAASEKMHIRPQTEPLCFYRPQRGTRYQLLSTLSPA